jgi:hypothetical protein
MPRRILPAALFGFAFSSIAASASAQIQQRPGTTVSQSAQPTKSSGDPVVKDVDGASYGVQFDDELLSAIAEDGTIPRIVIRAVRGFGQLNRPRVSFVRELAKSVEAI